MSIFMIFHFDMLNQHLIVIKYQLIKRSYCNNNLMSQIQSQQFKSYSDHNTDHVQELFIDVIEQRHTLATQNRLLEIYNTNKIRKQKLLDDINRLESKKIKRQLVLCLQRNSEADMIEFIESDQEVSFPKEIQLIYDDYIKKKTSVQRLETQYKALKNQYEQQITELELNSKVLFKSIAKDVYKIIQYVHLKYENKIAILYTGKGQNYSTLKFRSLQLRNKVIRPIKLEMESSHISISETQQHILIQYDKYFGIYSLKQQRFTVKSYEHESKIIYSQFMMQKNELSIVSCTQNGIVRIFSLAKNKLISLIKCQNASKYALKATKLLFTKQKKLMCLNLLTKEIYPLFEFSSQIEFFTQNSIKLAEGWVNSFFENEKIVNNIQLHQTIYLKENIELKYAGQKVLINGTSIKEIQNKKMKLVAHYQTVNSQKINIKKLIFGSNEGYFYEHIHQISEENK